MTEAERPLLSRLASVGATIPHTPLATLPTSILQADELATLWGLEAGQLFVKQDNQTGAPFGGNKVRKLEFLLAEAQRQGKGAVVTFGYAGSNHATATAVLAKQLGLRAYSQLLHQANTSYLAHNQALQRQVGARLDFYHSKLGLALGTLGLLVREVLRHGRLPYIIPAGGSNVTGALGYVNAGLELAAQVQVGLMPKPNAIYVASSTLGTAAGLAVGLRMAKLNTKLHLVQVYDPRSTNQNAFERMADSIAKRLNRLGLEVELGNWHQQIQWHSEQFGEGYAIPTPAAQTAVREFAQQTSLRSETTYSGKALAALRNDAQTGKLKRETVLYWHTFGGQVE